MVGPTTSAKPVGVRRSPRTGASVRTSRPSARAAGNRPRPPAIPANTGPGEAEPARGRGGDQRASPLQRTSWGTVARADSSRAWPAYTPPSRGSTSRSTTSSPSRVATSSPTDTSSPSARGRPGVSWRSRSRPASDSTPEAATCVDVGGTPITERGSGRSAPLVQTEDDVGGGVDDRHPELASEVDALGPARQHRLRAEVDLDAADLAGEQLAADARRALEHQHVAPGRAPGPARRSGRRCRRRRRRRRGAAGRACAQPVTHASTEPAAGTGRRTPMRTTRLLAVSATALLLSLTACSGGSDADSPEPPRPWTAAPPAGPPATWPPSRHPRPPAPTPPPARQGAAPPATRSTSPPSRR